LSPRPEASDAGHAFYTRRSLAFYDLVVLGYFSRVAWRCPPGRVLRHYDEHVTANHLDIGVGTGYFLDQCAFPSPSPRLVLMDPNAECLDAAALRAARYAPECVQASVLDPLDIDAPGFDSIGMTYLLHCLPGDIRSKSIVFENLQPAANPGAVVFGATLLHGGVDRNRYATAVMKWNNDRGIFSNVDDDADGLQWALSQHLEDVTIEILGCVALFAGRT
jgi:hypothetical protein